MLLPISIELKNYRGKNIKSDNHPFIRKRMKTNFCRGLVLILILFPSLAWGQVFSFSVDGTLRSYRLHLPAGYTAGMEYPLVLNFHGLGSSASEQEAYSQMNVVADANSFIVVYPEGINTSWNAGLTNQDVDDMGFVNALLDTLINKYSVNEARIYATGFSMGGFFSYRLACGLAHRIAAVAPVAAIMIPADIAACAPARDVPVLHIHGTIDGVIAYSFGVETVVNFWATRNNCSTPGDTTHLPDINSADNSTVDLIRYSHCNDNSEVWFYKIYGGGHTWPGAALDIEGINTNRDFNASLEIWNFFNRFSLTGVTGIDKKTTGTALSLYPNPASDIIRLKGVEGIVSVRITDLSGKALMEYQRQNGEGYKVSGLGKGLYILQVRTVSDKNYQMLFVKE